MNVKASRYGRPELRIPLLSIAKVQRLHFT